MTQRSSKAPLEIVSSRSETVDRGNRLEDAIGRQVHIYRTQLGVTIANLARQAGLSPGMLSKIENGQTSPSLTTLQALAGALNVPVTALFRKFEQDREASFVKAGQGLVIDRRGTRAGHQYHLLGHSVGDRATLVEPYLIVISEASDVFPLFQHDGVEFIYMLEGQMVYRHGSRTYAMNEGDSLYFDADAPHGPEELNRLPIRFLSFIVEPQSGA
ncbi:MAG: XRE family transcriptional regulator [Gammaproteobacteria bacterium]